MISIKGFVEIPSFANNAAGEVAPLGELSPISKTYSTEIGIYTSPIHPLFNLRVFSSYNETETNEPLSNHQIERAFLILGYIYQQMESGNTSDRTALLNQLSTQFAAQIEQINAGPIVNGVSDLPQWISWKNIGEDTYYRFWFSDGAFKNQYDISEIKVVLPLNPPDQFFLHPNNVKTLIAGITPATIVSQMNAAIGNTPQTSLNVLTFDFVNPLDPSDRTPVYFGTIIHGWTANNLDAQKTAIIDLIMANTTHTREEWTVIFPDLFKRTEFIIVPMFDRYAIPNMVVQAGIYSPYVPVNDILAYTQTYAADYPVSHVNAHTGVVSLVHRSLIAAVIGSPENMDEKYSLMDFYSDYIAINSVSHDFNRMELTTQQWAIMLDTAVKLAEVYDINSEMLPNMSRVRRNDILYIAFSHNNVQYLVPIKSNF